MKKLIFLLSFLIFGINLVNAGNSCTPSSGYNRCWEADNSYGDALAYAQVQINNVPQGIKKEGYYIGPAWIPWKFYGESFYVATNVGSWSNLWDNVASCGKWGCSGTLLQHLSDVTYAEGKYYLVNNPGDRYTDCPAFYAWMRDGDPSGTWAWVSTGYGWALSGNCFDIKSIGCYDDSDCNSGYVCDKSGTWETWNCKEGVNVEILTYGIEKGFSKGDGSVIKLSEIYDAGLAASVRYSATQDDRKYGITFSLRDSEGKVTEKFWNSPMGKGWTSTVHGFFITELDGTTILNNKADVYDGRFQIWDETAEPLETLLADTGWITNFLTVEQESLNANLNIYVLEFEYDNGWNLIAQDISEINDDGYVYLLGYLKDANNNPILNQEVDFYINDNKVSTQITEDAGGIGFPTPPQKAHELFNVGNNEIKLNYIGSENYSPSSITKTLNVISTVGPYDCTTASDCVGEQSCHPYSCINVAYAPGFGFCTQECKEGTMDCGMGQCKCVDGQCEAIIFECGVPGTPIEAETITETCSDGSEIIVRECVNNFWVETNEVCLEECVSHAYLKCSTDDIFWYDSCGVREDKKEECGALGCLNDNECNVEPTSTEKIIKLTMRNTGGQELYNINLLQSGTTPSELYIAFAQLSEFELEPNGQAVFFANLDISQFDGTVPFQMRFLADYMINENEYSIYRFTDPITITFDNGVII